LVPSIYANAHGAITGLGNVAPHTIKRIFTLASDPTHAHLGEAQTLQGIVARADRTIAVQGIAGTKYLLDRLYGYGGAPRRPLLPFEEEAGKALWAHPHVVELVEIEKQLAN